MIKENKNNEPISALFFGTHDFAVKILKGLLESSRFSVVGVVTQPDKPTGRSGLLLPTPVKKLAIELGVPIFTPISLKQGEKLGFPSNDINIVAEYGKIIPNEILESPRFGTINVHTSLLPKYRGASPIQTALINGETRTGVTIMLMDEGLDTGPILAQSSVDIPADATYQELETILANVGQELLVRTVINYIESNTKTIPQEEKLSSYAGKLKRDSGHVDWSRSANELYNLYRGLHPWPGIWSLWNGKRVKFIKVKPASLKIQAGMLVAKDGTIHIGCGKDALQILELQLEGKRPMSAADFISGYAEKISGAILR